MSTSAWNTAAAVCVSLLLLGGCVSPPAMAAKPAEAVPAACAPATVIVSQGDTLSAIALRHYGKSARAALIAEANADRISHPDRIFVGQELRLPGRAGSCGLLRAPLIETAGPQAILSRRTFSPPSSRNIEQRPLFVSIADRPRRTAP